MTRSRCPCCSGGRHDGHRGQTSPQRPGPRSTAAPARTRNSCCAAVPAAARHETAGRPAAQAPGRSCARLTRRRSGLPTARADGAAGRRRSCAGWPASPGTPGSSGGRHPAPRTCPEQWLELPLGWLAGTGRASLPRERTCQVGAADARLRGRRSAPAFGWMMPQAHELDARSWPSAATRRVRPAARAGTMPGRTGSTRTGRPARGHQHRDDPGLQGRPRHATSPSGTAWSWPMPSRQAGPAAARESRLLPPALHALGHLPRRRPGHDPRVRHGPGTADRRGTRRPLPAAVQAGPRPARGLPEGTAARPGLRQPGPISAVPGRLFWARIEALSPGIGTLQLPPDVARAWKEDLQTVKRSVTGPDGEQDRRHPARGSTPRTN